LAAKDRSLLYADKPPWRGVNTVLIREKHNLMRTEMATNGELAAARLVDRLMRLETEFENLVDSVKSEYHECWDQMSQQEMDDFVRLLDLQDQKALRQFMITRGENVRARLFPGWMLEE